ncbi:MAG: DJ-1/PfpI family protein [Myxococcota bacterium]
MTFTSTIGSLWLGATLAADPGRAATPESTPARPVLVVLSAASTQTLADGTTRATGFFLNGFYEVKRGLDGAGITYRVATPQGRRPALDPESLNEKYWASHPEWRDEAVHWFEHAAEVQNPQDLRVAATTPEAFSAVLVPGGQGVMVDLLRNASLHSLLLDVGRSKRPIGLVCHAPAVLAELPKDTSPFVGRRVTSVSNIEELYIERVVMGARARDRKIGRSLRRAGLRHRAAFPGRSNATRDGNLVTSQNPFSGDAFVELFLAALVGAKG